MDYTKSYFKTYTMNKYFDIDYLWGALTILCGLVVSFVSPVAPFIVMAMSLLAVDFVTGTMAARKRGEPIVSRGYRRSLEKFFLYSAIILTSEGMKVVFMQYIPLTYFVALAICMTEFKSNIENVEYVTGTNIWVFIKKKLNRLYNE